MSGKKSGLRTLVQGEVLFHETDTAESLYIIQSGQIRLYRPKGKGFVEIAILRAGEVIGEMAYFDERNQRRSCSAAAIYETEIVEISFVALSKTMANLNPWFKTIIQTLANRLRQTNERVKSLDDNSVGFSTQGKAGDYIFFHNIDVIKMLTTLYLSFEAHGTKAEKKYQLTLDKFKFYLLDVYSVPEIKFEEFLKLLKDNDFINLTKDDDGQLKIIEIEDPQVLRSIFIFINNQRMTEDSKKLKISFKCERFLSRIIEQVGEHKDGKPQAEVNISKILSDFKDRNVPIFEEDLKDAISAGLADEILIGKSNDLTSVVAIGRLKRIFPAVRMSNCVKRINDEKAASAKGKIYR